MLLESLGAVGLVDIDLPSQLHYATRELGMVVDRLRTGDATDPLYSRGALMELAYRLRDVMGVFDDYGSRP